MYDTRDITYNCGPGDTFPYNSEFLLWESYAVFDKETALSIGLACLMVYIVTGIMMADFITAAVVLVMVGMVDVCILGMLHFWDGELNAVSIANIVIAIGIAVDYNSHLAHAFKSAVGTRQERVISALDTVGLSIFHGSFSTFLAVLVLSFSESYIFIIFFKAWFGIVVFGSIHGLILLPVVLSWFGRPSTHVEDYRESTFPSMDFIETERVQFKPNKI